MLVSLRWLKDYVDIEISPAELAEHLTMTGLEVDALQEKIPAFSGLVVAKILSIAPHPNADTLSLCEVTTGSATYRLVCGAKNIRKGDLVPLAMVGATIPGGYTIKSSKIRGVESEGMLCSEEELGIGADATGIMILPGDLSLGQDLADALNLKDTILDIGVTPNRSDCLSIMGVAREVAAVTGKRVRYPLVELSESEEDIKGVTSIEILDPDLCPRYTARIIKGVSINQSPLWMRLRLEAVGLRAINNIVDVTNFVMMELGQPLHAFDYRYLDEGRILVRRSRPGESFISLDGKEHILRTDTLMICDGRKPVAIGGIMGGLNSEVTENTETILLESAYFNPISIRRSSKSLQMSTDAAFRFERGIDPDGQVKAVDRAAQLIADISGGKICRNVIDRYPKKIETVRDIPLRIKRVCDILGTDIGASEIIKILECLEMSVKKTDAESYLVTPPTFRIDIIREIDLIEEIARLYGYDRVALTMPDVSVMSTTRNGRDKLEDRIKDILAGCGYSEVVNYSFIAPEAVERLGLKGDDERRRVVKIRNPLTEEQSVMRTTMVYSLLETMKKNASAGCFDLKIFEMGRVYLHRQEGSLPVEKNRLGCLLTGTSHDDLWHCKNMQADFYDLKGCVESLLDDLKIRDVKFRSDVREAFLHPVRSAGICTGDTIIGFLGEVHPDLLSGLNIKNPAIVCELDIEMLTALCTGTLVYRELSRYPSSSRDVAFLVGKDMEADGILAIIQGDNEELLEKVSIFDVYEGKGIPSGIKSLGLRFSYRSTERTLTDEEVNRVHDRIVRNVVTHTGAKIRGE